MRTPSYLLYLQDPVQLYLNGLLRCELSLTHFITSKFNNAIVDWLIDCHSGTGQMLNPSLHFVLKLIIDMQLLYFSFSL